MKIWQKIILIQTYIIKQKKYIIIFIGLEILTGIMMYYFKFPFSTQPIHLFLASLLFGAQSFFMIRIFKKYDFQN